jgi:hypothetical protein
LTTSALVPTRPMFRGSPGMPWAVTVVMGRPFRPD